MPRFGYTASEYTDLLLIYGECRGNAALALRTYRERYEKTRLCPTNSRTIVQALQRIRENQSLIPTKDSAPPVVTSSRDDQINDLAETSTVSLRRSARHFQECPIIAETDAGPSSRSAPISHDVVRPRTAVVTMPQVVSSKTSNSRFLVVGHDQDVQASTGGRTPQHRYARSKRKGLLPEAETIIKSVFNYLQTEYENLKTYTGGSCDLSPLEDILGRTAAATGVSDEVVTSVLEEVDSDDSSHVSSSKRARVSRDYDENISPIEEDSSGESSDEAQPDNIESSIEIEENPIETLKLEIDDNVEYHSKPNPGILFQIPFSREQMSVLHPSLTLTEPTPAVVKQEPADVEEQQYSSFHIIRDMAVERGNLSMYQVKKPRQTIRERSNKPPKTSTERSREFRARQTLLKQQNKQQQVSNAKLRIAIQDVRTAGPSEDNLVPDPSEKRTIDKRSRSAKSTRRWRERKKGVSGSSKKQAKTPAQRMREYRQRKRMRISALHQSLSLTEPTPAVVKQEPADVEEQQRICALHQSLSLTEPAPAVVKQEPADFEEQQRICAQSLSLTEPTHAVVKQEPADVEEQQYSPFQIIDDIAIEHDNNQMEVNDAKISMDLVEMPRRIIGVRSNKKPPKTPAERAREFRARQALLKQQSKQQQEPDAIVELATETEDILNDGQSKKRAKTVSQRMREYRKRKKLRLKQLEQSTAVEDTGVEQDLLRDSAKPRKTNAEYQKAYRERVKAKKNENKQESSVKPRKTNAEYQKEYRERQKAKKKENKQESSAKPRKTKAEYQKEYRERQKAKKKMHKQESTAKQPKTNAEHQKAFRERQKMKKIKNKRERRLKQLEQSKAVEDTGVEQDPLGESTSAVHHLLQSNFEATSEAIKVEQQDTEYPSSPTTQVGRQPD